MCVCVYGCLSSVKIADTVSNLHFYGSHCRKTNMLSRTHSLSLSPSFTSSHINCPKYICNKQKKNDRYIEIVFVQPPCIATDLSRENRVRKDEKKSL